MPETDTHFERYAKWFFWVAGLVTIAGALPIALGPVWGTHLVFGFDYFGKSPEIFPLVGHWGIMVTGIGVLLFVSATRKQLRWSTAIFSTIEKAYMVSIIIYFLVFIDASASAYYPPLIADSLMTIGGAWYLLRSRALGSA
jgi:hypothetical protein